MPVSELEKGKENVTPDEQKEDVAELLGITKKEEGEQEEVVDNKEVESEEAETTEESEASSKDNKEGKEDEGKEEEDETSAKEDTPDLVTELARLSQLLTTDQKVEDFLPGEKEEKKETEEKEITIEKQEEEVHKATKPTFEEIPFAGDKDFEGTFDEKDRKTFNSIINKVVEVTSANVQKATIQKVMEVFPRLINHNINGAIAAQEFWTANPGLKDLADKNPGLRNYVQYRANEVQKTNPKKHLGEVYAQVQTELTALLKAQLEKGGASETKSGRPGLARRPGAQRSDSKKSNLTNTQKEILELMNR
jgi:hypothetical protein